MLENSLTNNEPPIEIQPDETGLTPAQRIGKKLRGKRRRPRLPDVPDDTPAAPAPAPPAEGAEQQRPAPPVDAKAQMQISPDVSVVSAGETAPPGDKEMEGEGDPRKQGSGRGGRNRLLFAAGAVGFVAVFFALLAFAVWFAFYRSAGGGGQSLAGRLGLTSMGGANGAAADPTAPPEMPVSADEIRRKTGAAAGAVDATAPATAGALSHREASAADAAAGGEQQRQQQMPSAYAQMGGAPITARLPYDSLSTTIAPASQPQQSTPAHSDSESSVDSSTGSFSRTRSSSIGGDEETASNSTTVSGNEEFGRAGGDLKEVRGANPEEHSMRAFAIRGIDAPAPRLASDFERSAARAAEPGAMGRDEATGVVLPPLGTLLPVRTLGRVYTLRSGALVRLQLTRDVGGAGWSLERGTELYGTLRGSDYDIARAYVSLVGFVDPRTNRLVPVSGDLLGSDGAEGLLGTRRRLHSRWSRAFRVAGASALDVLSSAASGFGRRTVVIADLYGDASGRAVSPLTQELNRTAGGNRAEGFVEVPSAAAGYALVLTMPAQEQGRHADPEGFLAAYPGAERDGRFASYAAPAPPPLATTRMTDDELANLLRFGSVAQIRRAWPRMSPEMRRAASHYLAGDE